MIQVEVTKNNNETSSSIIRRFTKRVQESGIIKRAKSRRYNERAKSEYVKKKKALKRLAKRTETARLRRLGKIDDAPAYRK